MTVDRAERPWRATVVTILPDMFPGPLGQSLSGKGLDTGLWTLETVDIRDFARDKHRSVDDTPAGGGAGMVMRVDVVAAALEEVVTPGCRTLLMTPTGAPFTQATARRLAGEEAHLVLLAGHYEGIDARIETLIDEQISLGDFVLTGGEIAACAVVDAVARLLPGVLGNDDSAADESFSEGLLEYPHYTRPAAWRGLEVPDVLRSGHHARIEAWRHEQALARTRIRRPDLFSAWEANKRTEADEG